jgi:hypothetical protein
MERFLISSHQNYLMDPEGNSVSGWVKPPGVDLVKAMSTDISDFEAMGYQMKLVKLEDNIKKVRGFKPK